MSAPPSEVKSKLSPKNLTSFLKSALCLFFVFCSLLFLNKFFMSVCIDMDTDKDMVRARYPAKALCVHTIGM